VTTDTHELAWAAGFFDGEGYSSLNNRKDGWKNIKVGVGQVHREPLDRFDRATGNIGNVLGPYTSRSYRQPFHEWAVTGLEKSQAVMTMLWPWLCSIKREQWTIVSEAMVAYKETIAEEQSARRRARKPGINALTQNQLDQVLRVIEPWRYEKEGDQ
jgi:hypothetical protein